MRRGTGGAVIALVLLVAVMVWRVPGDAARIERDIQTRATRALIEATLPWASVDADGRFLTLSGTAPSAPLRNRAEAVLLLVDGVLAVHNDLEVTRVLEGPG